MTYSEIDDIKNQLPFTVDDNSLPDGDQLSGMRTQANLLINAWIGPRDTDIPGSPGTLRLVETITAVDWALAWHEGRSRGIHLSKDSKVILDNYKSGKKVYIGDLVVE